MEDLSDFQRGQIIGARLAEASVPKMATLLGVSRAAVSKVMTTYTDLGRTSSAKKNSGQKLKLRERDRHTLKRIVYINHRSTEQLNIPTVKHGARSVMIWAVISGILLLLYLL